MTLPSSAHRPSASPTRPPPLQLGAASLDKSVFLRKALEFKRVKDEGRTNAGQTMVLGVLPAPDGRTRLGLIVSRRYDRSAVHRNRARRLMREAFRLIRPAIAEPFWLVTIARHRLHGGKTQWAQEDLLRLLERAGVTVNLSASGAG